MHLVVLNTALQLCYSRSEFVGVVPAHHQPSVTLKEMMISTTARHTESELWDAYRGRESYLQPTIGVVLRQPYPPSTA